MTVSVFRTPDCHPERPYRAKGLCALCYRSANAVKLAAAQRAYVVANKSKVSEGLQRYRRDNKEKVAIGKSATKRRALYGITPEAFNSAIVTQGHACKLCFAPFKNSKSTHVDHDHVTCRLRGLLCPRCNTRIAHLEIARSDLDRLFNYCDTAILIADADKRPQVGSSSRWDDHRVSDTDFAFVLDRQNNCCKLCQTAFTGSLNTHVDHCHATGRRRGLLCNKCNVRLGSLERSRHDIPRLLHYCDNAIFGQP